MHIATIKKLDTANGLGIRTTIFVSGCTNHCKGCFQPETWDFEYGQPYTPAMEDDILADFEQPYVKGLTILGGEPFEPSNQEGLINLIRRMKNEYPKKDIWMFTGFTYDVDLMPGGRKYTEYTDEILDSIDILVDGRFVEELRNLCLKFRGSENQRIIDMKATREAGHVILSPLNK